MKQEKKQNSKGGQKDMKKKVKRFISIIMVMAMVFAMAAGCGKKEESAADKDEAQTEAAVEDQAESEDEATDEAVEPEEGTIDEDKNEYGFTESQIESLLLSIQMAVLTEYLEPNEIFPTDFVWPDELEEDWRYLDSRLMYYQSGVDIEMPDDVSPELDYSLMKVVYESIITWFEDNGLNENCNQNMSNLRLMLEPISQTIPKMISFK